MHLDPVSGQIEERMIGCDYNGWNDLPEDEREWLDQFPELSRSAESLDAQRSPGVAPGYVSVGGLSGSTAGTKS